MMFGFGLMSLFLGLSLAVLCTIGLVTAGMSALPLAVWSVLLVMATLCAFAGLLMATTD